MLVVVRTITTVAWLFDILPELLADHRIQVVFTLNGEGSAYEAGVADAVCGIGGRILPWEQAVATPFSLAISASYYGGLDQLRSPLLVLPHGPGYTRKISVPSNGLPPIPALPGSRVKTTIALSHEEQRVQWQESTELGTQAVVIGDPCFDRLQASIADREPYRRALGVSDAQKLIVTTSTWGPRSSFATRPDLTVQLLAQLPADEYDVAAILHPNIWVGHGSWQVRLWMRRGIESGVRLIPFREGWRGAIVAADSIIGDHGSVTFYAAALGTPVLLNVFNADELVPATPLAAFGERAPYLSAHLSLREQVERLGFDRDPARYQDLARRMFAAPGRALERLRSLIYDLIDLHAPPSQPRVLPVAAPKAEQEPVTAHLVRGKAELDSARPRVTLERFPAALDLAHLDEALGRHLAVDEAEPDHRLRESAAVILRASRTEPEPRQELREAARWATSALRTYPGARIAAAALDARHWVLHIRHGPLVQATVDHATNLDTVASALYLALITGQPDLDLERGLSVATGAAQAQVRLKVLPAPFDPAAPEQAALADS